MKVINFLFIFFSSFSTLSQCGETEILGLPYSATPDIISKDNDGHLLISLYDSGNTRLIMMDHSRNILKQKYFAGFYPNSDDARIYSLAVDNENNIYICGSFNTGINFGSGYTYNVLGGSTSIFIAKLNHDFQPIWVKISEAPTVVSSSGSNDIAKSITVDSLGGVYFSVVVTGNFIFQGQDMSLPNNSISMLISRIDPSNGQIIWSQWQNPNSSSGRYPYLVASQHGGFYEVIHFDEILTDNQGHVFTEQGTFNCLIIYFDSLGNHLWNKKVGGKNSFSSIDINENGDLVMYGALNHYINVGTDTVYNLYKKSMYFLELNLEGNATKLKRIITSELSNTILTGIYSMDYLENGEFLVSGTTKEEINFNGIIQPALDSLNVTSFIAKYDSNFTPIWTKTFGIGRYVLNHGVKELNGCSAYYLGSSWDYFYYEDIDSLFNAYKRIPFLIEFDLNTGEIAGSSIPNTNDPFGPNGVPGSSVGVEELTGIQFILYPNPVTDFITIKSESQTTFHWRMFDLFGKLIISGDANNQTQIDMSILPIGMYLISVDDGTNLFTKKVVKN